MNYIVSSEDSVGYNVELEGIIFLIELKTEINFINVNRCQQLNNNFDIIFFLEYGTS